LFLTGQCTKIIVSETTVAIGIKLCRNGVWKLLYKKKSSFCYNVTRKMVTGWAIVIFLLIVTFSIM
jgi:hypothetical protein